MKHNNGLFMKTIIRFCLLVLITGWQQPLTADNFDQLPDLGSNSSNFLSPNEEKQLGQAFIRQSRRQLDYITDPEIINYVNDIGKTLGTFSDQPEQAFTFYVINNPTINAFAVPGGHIAIHTGLLLKSNNESELASVLAHEIAHITQKHIARRLESSRFDGILALGALLAAAAAGGDAAQAAFITANAAIADKQLRYSRAYELEADSLGIRILSKANYSPQAMPAFFERLLQESKISKSNAPEFLRSHPLTVNRIAESAERANGYPDNSKVDNKRFLDIQAKVNVNYSKHAKQTLSAFAEKAKQSSISSSPHLHYGYALALSKNNQFNEARKVLSELTAQHPDNLSYQLAMADNELEARNIDKGLGLLKALNEQQRNKDNYLIDIYYANALILSKKPGPAIPLLRQAIRYNRQEPLLHILLARAYGETNDLLKSYQSRAEYHYLQGNFAFALKQLKNAQTRAKTDYDKASIAARIYDVEAEIESLEKIL